MKIITRETKKPYEGLKHLMKEFLEGRCIEINVEEPLDLIEDMCPKIQIHLMEGNGNQSGLHIIFSTYHQDFSDIAESAEIMLKINRLLDFLLLQENVRMRADLIEDMSDYYLTLEYEESLESGKYKEFDEEKWFQKLNTIINMILCLAAGNYVI